MPGSQKRWQRNSGSLYELHTPHLDRKKRTTVKHADKDHEQSLQRDRAVPIRHGSSRQFWKGLRGLRRRRWMKCPERSWDAMEARLWQAEALGYLFLFATVYYRGLPEGGEHGL